jgi:hypothetical protein
VVPPGGTRGAALEQAGALPAVLGQRSGHNVYLLDGVKVTDEFFNNLLRENPNTTDTTANGFLNVFAAPVQPRQSLFTPLYMACSGLPLCVRPPYP